MAEYTYKELMKMQNDAIRRAEDMKSRAQKQAGLNRDSPQEDVVAVDTPRRIPMTDRYLPTTDNSVNTTPPHHNQGNFFDVIKNNFKDINIDKDRALLLSLILLLTEENADESLIMALIYML